jgi:hypothetical protein
MRWTHRHTDQYRGRGSAIVLALSITIGAGRASGFSGASEKEGLCRKLVEDRINSLQSPDYKTLANGCRYELGVRRGAGVLLWDLACRRGAQ